MKKLTLVVFICSLFTLGTQAQSLASYGEFGLTGGGMYYLGEDNPGTPFWHTKPAFGAFYRHTFNTRTAVTANFLHGRAYQTTVNEIGVRGEFNFYEYFVGANRNVFTPYIFGGVGMAMMNYHHPIAETDTTGMAAILPFGIGLKTSLGSRFSLSLEWGMRKFLGKPGPESPGDWLEGITKEEYNNNGAYVLNNDLPTHNRSYNDWYSYAGLSLAFKIFYPRNNECLDVFK